MGASAARRSAVLDLLCVLGASQALTRRPLRISVVSVLRLLGHRGHGEEVSSAARHFVRYHRWLLPCPDLTAFVFNNIPGMKG